MDRKAIKAKAKEFAFKNKWNIWKPLLAYLLISALAGAVVGVIVAVLGQEPDGSLSQMLQYVVEFAILPMSIGCTAYVMNLLKGKTMSVKEALFSKYSAFALIIGVSIVVSLMTFVWALLLIIPGIIYAYKMAMVNYILADEECGKLSWREVMDRSEKLMNGHKMDLFVFELSFIGWALLSIVTLGIGLIWFMPYVEVATIMYYEELKKIAK